MPRSSRLKLHQFVEDLVKVGQDHLTAQCALPAEAAGAAMIAITRAFCERNAKSLVYIPEAANLAKMERNAIMWAKYQVDGTGPTFARKFTPERLQEIAAEYDLTPQQLYNIFRDERAAELSLLQASLFPES